MDRIRRIDRFYVAMAIVTIALWVVQLLILF